MLWDDVVRKILAKCANFGLSYENFSRGLLFTGSTLRMAGNQEKKLEITMHHLRGNAIPAGPLNDSAKLWCCCGIPTLYEGCPKSF